MATRNFDSAAEQAIRSSSTWVELVQLRAAQMGERSAYTFLADGDRDERCVTYAELDRVARALAAAMREGGEVGQRALLLVPAGPEFVRAFFACLYAGMVAVPVPLPSSKRGLPRVLGIVRDCRPSVVLTTQRFLDTMEVERNNPALAELRALRWIALESADRAGSTEYRRPAIDAQTVAFLQYTSGSTGTPKGVVLTHENLLANQRAIGRAFDHDERSVIVGWLPPFHDMGLIGNVLQPIFLGVDGVHMAPQHFLVDPFRWLAAISRYRATTSGGPNFAYELCAHKITAAQRAELDLSSWKVAFNGAEPVRAATLRRFQHVFADAGFSERAFYPCYGLAEATLLVSGGIAEAAPVIATVDASALETGRLTADAASDHALVGCGISRDIDVAIVHPETHVRCGPGEVGEVWLSGASVAHGYWQRPEESVRTFGARLASGEGPYLRTGDLGALVGDELFITGRLKDLIIVRGRNIYPQDLETASIESGLATAGCNAAAFAVEGDAQLVIVQEVRSGADHQVVARAIREAVADRFEIALHAVVLIASGRLPRTTSGKVQRRATRDRWVDGTLDVKWSDVEEAAAPSVGDPPQGELECALASIWESVLERAPGSIGRHQEIVQLGSDSLQAIQIGGRIADLLGVRISGAQLFDTPTVASLAAWLAAQPKNFSEAATSQRVPLSPAQERLWFTEQLAAGEPIHHVAGAVRIRGALDVDALSWAVNALVARHDALRTRFSADREGLHQHVAAAAPISLPLIEAHGRVLTDLVADDLRRPFSLATEAPARFVLVRLDAADHALVFVGHHLVLDGWSTSRLVRDLWTLYRARELGGPLPAPVLGCYAEFACARREPTEANIAYWRAQFARPLAPLELLTDRPRGALQTHRGARLERALPAALSAGIQALGRAQSATPFVVFCAGYGALLARTTGQHDLCLGTPMMARERARDEDVVGCYLDTLALRIDLAGDPSFPTLIARVRETLTGAQRHRALSFARLLELVNVPRDLARTPLFQTMISMQPAQDVGSEGWAVEQLDTGTAQLDVALDVVTQRDGHVRLAWEYNTDLFDRQTVEQLANDYVALLARWVQVPDQRLSALPWQSDEALAALPVGRVEAALPVHVQISGVAAEIPDAVAVVGDHGHISYAALEARASQLAHVLRAEGVALEQPVAILAARGPGLLVAILAVLKAGAAYLLLDPAQPLERTRTMLDDARVTLVVGDEALSGLRHVSLDDPRIDCAPTTTSAAEIHPKQLAYVLYTSGSTGRPKGVGVTHEALASTLTGWRAAYGEALVQPRVLSLAGAAFDVFTADWVRALCQGGTLVLGAATLARDPRGILAALTSSQITLVDLVPAQVEALLPLWPAEGLALRAVVVGSDVWSLQTMRALRAALPSTCRVMSCYGVTEAAIDSAWFEQPIGDGDQAVPLGEAFASCALYVLDAADHVLPDGVPGELAIAGSSLARGYIGQPALTAERFIPDPRTPGARLYRTGDRVRRDHRGTLSFLGRIDAQVKVRGVRVELGEIEACLRAQPHVRAACVAMQAGELIAYVVSDRPLDEAAVRAALRDALPMAMQPSAYVTLASLPLSANGKVDRRALPPYTPQRTRSTEAALPTSPLEKTLAEIWRELLPGREVSLHDNFFDLGGHSLLLAKMQSRLLDALGREVPVLTMLQHPTIGALAAALDGSSAKPAQPPSIAERESSRGAGDRRAELLARRRGGAR